MGNSWQDAIEEKSKKFLAISKEQIDYYLLHKEFSYIKKRSLSTVRINCLRKRKQNAFLSRNHNLFCFLFNKLNIFFMNAFFRAFIYKNSIWKTRRKTYTNTSTTEPSACLKTLRIWKTTTSETKSSK